MAIKHRRLNVTARWLHRCPECGAWFALRLLHKQQSISGTEREYICSRCHARSQDWKPSDSVKF